MNKNKKSIYLSNNAIKKLKLLKSLNGLDASKIIELLIAKQKKLQLF